MLFRSAFGKILPENVLSLPGFGCINVHASLLPKWRGASPIQNTLLAGETKTGITIMLMDKGLDTGDILSQRIITIEGDDTRETLTKKMIDTSKALLIETIPLWIERKIQPTKQDESEATLCQLIEREDGRIIFTDDAKSIYDRFRALSPWPGIFAFWKKSDGLLRVKFIDISYQPNDPAQHYSFGEVFRQNEYIGIKTGLGVLIIQELQLEGKTAVKTDDFLRGNPEFVGSFLQ